MRPATDDDFLRELTACLILVAPSGMSDDDRTEWLITARATLADVPADLLARGAAVARKYSDHPSKIVSTIMREIEVPWENRKRQAHSPDPRLHREEATPIGKLATPTQIEEIKAEFGLHTTPYAEQQKPTGPQRMPSREDYIALGIAPEVLDRISGPKEKAA